MSENDGESGGGGGFWSVWSSVSRRAADAMQAASSAVKQVAAKLPETGELVEAYKNDLKELVSVVRTDIIGRAQQLVSDELGADDLEDGREAEGDSARGAVEYADADDDQDDDADIAGSSRDHQQRRARSASERLHAALQQLQSDAATFDDALPIAGDAEASAFADAFDVDAHTDRIAELLKGNARLDHLHGALVPLELTYHEFWLRYFYREHVLRTTFALLDADEQQRNALRAAQAVADDAESAVTAPAPPALAPVAAAASSLASNASSVDFGFPKPPSAALPMPQPPPLDGATTAGDADVGAATPLRERLAHVDSETSWEQVDDAPPAETDTPGEQSARAPAPALARAAPPADDEDGWGEWS